MPCPHEGPGPLPWGSAVPPSLPAKGQGLAGQTEGRVIGPGAWLGDAGWTCWRSLGCHPIERGDLSGFRGQVEGRKPRAQARPCSLPLAFRVCLSALTSLRLSRTRRPGFAFWLRHMPSVAQAGTELDSSAKVFPSGASLAHGPKALSGTGSGKGDEEEWWSGRREPVCLHASLRAPFCSGG